MTRADQLEVLANLTKQMRASQKAYFRTRDVAQLLAAKDFEKQVDAALEELDRLQQYLFD